MWSPPTANRTGRRHQRVWRRQPSPGPQREQWTYWRPAVSPARTPPALKRQAVAGGVGRKGKPRSAWAPWSYPGGLGSPSPSPHPPFHTPKGAVWHSPRQLRAGAEHTVHGDASPSTTHTHDTPHPRSLVAPHTWETVASWLPAEVAAQAVPAWDQVSTSPKYFRHEFKEALPGVGLIQGSQSSPGHV
jgi:hypothetical protein